MHVCQTDWACLARWLGFNKGDQHKSMEMYGKEGRKIRVLLEANCRCRILMTSLSSESAGRSGNYCSQLFGVLLSLPWVVWESWKFGELITA